MPRAALGSAGSLQIRADCRLGGAMGDEPSVRYAKSSDGYLAYQVLGEGPVDVLRPAAGPGISIDSIADEPRWDRFDRRLGSFTRLIRFDRRGVGLSDSASPATPPTLEQNVQDAVAVLDAAGSSRAAVFTWDMGGPIAVMLSATLPGRVSHLVLYHSAARFVSAPDYPWAWSSTD